MWVKWRSTRKKEKSRYHQVGNKLFVASQMPWKKINDHSHELYLSLYMYVFIVWYSREFSRLHNLHPSYWNSLLYGLIAFWGEFSAFSAVNSIDNFHNFRSTRYPSLLGGQRRHDMLREACPTPLHMAGSVTRAPVTHPCPKRAQHCLTSVIWRELVTSQLCATIHEPSQIICSKFGSIYH